MVNRDQMSTCCFACRQVISEFFEDDAKITCFGKKEEKTFTKKELCPYPFDEDDLK